MRRLILYVAFSISNIISISAQPTIQWQKCFGGSESDVPYSIQQTSDNGFIVVGYTESNDSDVTVNHGTRDYWIVKLNSVADMEWQKSLGGTSDDMPTEIHQTSDGGYIIGGYSISHDIDITGNHGQEDYWIVKTDNLGTIQWQKSLGGSNIERAYSIKETTSGGYIVAGSSNSTDGDITFHHGGINIQHDCWIVNLDNAGSILWQKCLGGGSNDVARSVQQTTDGGFIVAGQTSSNDGDVTGHHGTTTYADFWIVKLNSSGAIQWQKSLGGTRDDVANSIQQTTDGGYIIAGDSRSSDGDVSLHWGSFVDNDFWVVKTDSTGTIVWEKTFGGTGTDMVHYISQTVDGGYILTGHTSSDDGDLMGLRGISLDYDYWIVKLNGSGIIEWQKVIGGTSNDVPRCIQQTNDDGYVVAGYSSSNNGDVTGNNGNGDFWIAKLSPVVGVGEFHNSASHLNVNPNPFDGSTRISLSNLSDENISIQIFDVHGRMIKNLVTEKSNTGHIEMVWDATDNSGNKADAGIYLLTVTAENYLQSKKVIVLSR